MEKITKRDIYSAILTAATENSINIENYLVDFTNEDLIAFCENEINLIDKKNEKAKSNAAKKRSEGDEITEMVYNALGAEDFEPMGIILSRIEDDSITSSKAVARLKNLYNNGRIEKQEIVVPDGEKKKKVMGYRRIG